MKRLGDRTAFVLAMTLCAGLVACDNPFGSSETELRFDEAELSLKPCDTHPLALRIRNAASEAVFWTSDRRDVATVSKAGVVTAHMPGGARITAVLQADTSRRASVSVRVASADSLLTMTGPAPDTIEAYGSQPLQVTVEFTPGCPIPDSRVTVDVPVIREERMLTLDGHGSNTWLTNAQGRLTLPVRLGRRAATTAITARGPGSLRDSVSITVLPSVGVRATATPRDTAVFAGAAFPLRDLVVLDRADNPVPASVPFTTSDPALATLSDLHFVRGQAPGRVHVMHGDMVAASVTVVPQATLLAGWTYYSTGHVISRVGLNGAGRTDIWQSASPLAPRDRPAASWHPSGQHFAFSDGDRINVSTLNGQVSTVATGEGAFSPAYSPDGELYFIDSRGLWRIGGDGGVARVETDRDIDFAWFYGTRNSLQPSFAPDGKSLLVNDANGSVVRIEPGTGAVTFLGVAADEPAWSPTGESIAYFRDGELWVMDADLSNRRRLANRDCNWGNGLAWSPDGRWIIAPCRMSTVLFMVDAQTGEMLPLFRTWEMVYPAWRPGP